MNERHYTDTGLSQLIDKLDEGEQTMLRVGGALPATFKELEPQLQNTDIARMIELVEQR